MTFYILRFHFLVFRGDGAILLPLVSGRSLSVGTDLAYDLIYSSCLSLSPSQRLLLPFDSFKTSLPLLRYLWGFTNHSVGYTTSGPQLARFPQKLLFHGLLQISDSRWETIEAKCCLSAVTVQTQSTLSKLENKKIIY